MRVNPDPITAAWSWCGRPRFPTPRSCARRRLKAASASWHSALMCCPACAGRSRRPARPSSAQAPCSPPTTPERAIDADARFLVTPGIHPDVARVATEAGVPVYLGAMTPTEVAKALDLGSSAVKIFPAGRLGPGYLKDHKGPYPDVRLLPSGGITAADARECLAAGALAVCCGTSVVPPTAVEAGDCAGIIERARDFSRALTK